MASEGEQSATERDRSARTGDRSATERSRSETDGDGSSDEPGQSTVGPAATTRRTDRRVIVVGYDTWTEPVLDELDAAGARTTVITTDSSAADALREDGQDVVETATVDEACFREAGVEDADHVLVATLDDHLNVLAVLTVDSVADVPIATFAAEERDVEKLRAAGADTVVSLGQAIAELVVEVAVTDRPLDVVVDDAVEELVGPSARAE